MNWSINCYWYLENHWYDYCLFEYIGAIVVAARTTAFTMFTNTTNILRHFPTIPLLLYYQY